MAFERLVEDHHKLTYTNNVKMVAQQLSNPLRAAVTTTNETGEAVNVADLLGKKDYIEGEDGSRRNPDNPTTASRRWLIRPSVVEDGEYIDKERKFDQAMDPASQLVRNSVATVERGVFDRILGVKKVGSVFKPRDGSGIYGSAWEGKTATNKVVIPATNYTAHGGTGLTIAKLRSAVEAMELADFGMEDFGEHVGGVFCIITPKQKTDLLNIALEAKGNVPAYAIEQIEKGKPTSLLGVTWLFSNRVPVDANNDRLIALWTKDNVVANFWQDVQGRMWNDGSAKNLPYIYTDAYVAATRVEDAGVRFIACKES